MVEQVCEIGSAVEGQPPAAHGQDAGPSILVLIVDPDPVARATSRTILDEAGYEVAESAAWGEAQALIDRRPPDVIVIDAAVLTAVHSSASAQRLGRIPASSIPVILVASVGDLEALSGVNSTVDDCIVKPIRPQELLMRIRPFAGPCRPNLLRRDRWELRGEQARMWNVLLDFSRAVARTQDLDSILEEMVMAAARMTCSRRVSIMLPDDQQQFLTIANAIGMDEQIKAKVRLPIGQAIAGQVFASGNQLTADASAARSRGETYGGESFVSVPIVAASLEGDHQNVGVLNITDRYQDRPFEEWELEFIDLLASIAGSLIDDAMWRQARESLLRFERDLELAKRIQQSTIPCRLPRLSGFEIGAWTEPAEDTGGDTYDVIGYCHEPRRQTIRLSSDAADRAVLLLADATGHGIGPALSVTQVRAMLRMAVRMQPDLSRIIRHMNEQLCADLPHGRFITAWLAELDSANHTVVSFSAGQGPLLRYDAARNTIRRLDADTIPLGIVEDLDFILADPVRMNEGDMLAVISDGVFEARNSEGRYFGVDRAANVILAHHRESPGQTLVALQNALARFTDGTPACDDRTAIIVKRVRA